jgi:uncharacterized protein
MVKEQLDGLLRRLVDEPDRVELDEFDSGDAIVFEARVAQGDLGKIIGRQGRTARAIRSLLTERGSQDGARYDFEVVDD